MTQTDGEAFLEELRSEIGVEDKPQLARDPVNQAMIRHWCDAMEDHNPVYTDPDFAAKSIHGEIVAPPTMLNAWTMAGNVPRRPDPESPQARVLTRLDEAGFTSVVATNSGHEYPRYPRQGEQLVGVQSITDVSQEKRTALGVGNFVTTLTEYRNQHGEILGRMKFRILKFKPGTGRVADGESAEARGGGRPLRPRPGISHDTRFFWEGLEQGELRIQRCSGCRQLWRSRRSQRARSICSRVAFLSPRG